MCMVVYKHHNNIKLQKVNPQIISTHLVILPFLLYEEKTEWGYWYCICDMITEWRESIAKIYKRMLYMCNLNTVFNTNLFVFLNKKN